MLKPKEMIAIWALELAKKLGRSEEDIRAKGLFASDFPNSVDIYYGGGDAKIYYNRAFAVINSAKTLAAVFTEHYGYIEFPLGDDVKVSETIKNILYNELE